MNAPLIGARSSLRCIRGAVALFVALPFFLSSPASAVDNRHRWNKHWGPLVPHTKFSGDCSLCHVAKDWNVIRDDFHFDHKKETGYALEGAHAEAACLRCHNDRGPVKAYVARGCGGCHSDPHKRALGTDCQRCHDQMSWQPVHAIAEHALTGFPLTGMHSALQCEQCHPRAPARDFRGASPACFGCHTADFARGPNHVAMNFARTCANCHTTTTWTGVIFDHSVLGNIANCYGCHAADYRRGPNHVAMNFPRSCGDCHATTTWAGALFNHAFLGSNPNCYACHAADYNRAPNHVGNFPMTCADCHTTTTWAGATFNHPFPQNHGGATVCSSCHTATPSSGANYTCTNACHPAGTTNSGHSGVSGYSYSSPACLNCHPNGQRGGN